MPLYQIADVKEHINRNEHQMAPKDQARDCRARAKNQDRGEIVDRHCSGVVIEVGDRAEEGDKHDRARDEAADNPGNWPEIILRPEEPGPYFLKMHLLPPFAMPYSYHVLRRLSKNHDISIILLRDFSPEIILIFDFEIL